MKEKITPEQSTNKTPLDVVAGILSQTRKMKRKIEIVAVERIRIRGEHGQIFCPVCQKFAEFLTTTQAAEAAGVRTESVRRRFSNGKARDIKSVGGRHRICRFSLFSRDAFFMFRNNKN